jgi:hypothetical protein
MKYRNLRRSRSIAGSSLDTPLIPYRYQPVPAAAWRRWDRDERLTPACVALSVWAIADGEHTARRYRGVHDVATASQQGRRPGQASVAPPRRGAARRQDDKLRVVVKQVGKGAKLINYPLLDNVGLNTDYTITDLGNGSMTFSATYGGQTRQTTAPVPAKFLGRTVRYQSTNS